MFHKNTREQEIPNSESIVPIVHNWPTHCRPYNRFTAWVHFMNRLKIAKYNSHSNKILPYTCIESGNIISIVPSLHRLSIWFYSSAYCDETIWNINIVILPSFSIL